MKRKDADAIIFLLDNRDKELSIRHVSIGLHIDYKSAHNIITRLAKTGLIELTPFGRSKRVTLKQTPHPLVYEAEHERRNKILKDKNIKTILDYFLSNLKTRLFIILLFGSYAKKTQTKASDIDLLFITPTREAEKDIHRVAAMIPLTIHLNIFTEQEFQAMKNSREPTVGSVALKNNIILYGIEAYHEL